MNTHNLNFVISESMPNLNIQLSFTLNREQHKEAEQHKEVPEEKILEEEPKETIDINTAPKITLDECLGGGGELREPIFGTKKLR